MDDPDLDSEDERLITAINKVAAVTPPIGVTVNHGLGHAWFSAAYNRQGPKKLYNPYDSTSYTIPEMRNLTDQPHIQQIETRAFKKYTELDRPLLQRAAALDTTRGAGCCAGWSAVLAQTWQDTNTLEDFENTILYTPIS